MPTFGQRFKELRLDKNLTQDEFVKEFNQRYGYSFSKSTISHYENDKRLPEYDALGKLLDFFDVTMDYLFGKSNYKKWDEEGMAMSTISIDGLSDEEIQQIRGMVDLLKKKHDK